MVVATNTEVRHDTNAWAVPRVIAIIIIFCVAVASPQHAQAASNTFKAGVAAIDISPQAYPVRANGGFLERTANSLLDPLYARAVALSDGQTTIVMCVVDSCMMPQDLIDQAKNAASKTTGIGTERMMVSATHTHSAPSAMACLGSRVDPAYAAFLPGKIAEAIEGAWKNLQPARVGWASIDDWGHAHNRRWIRRADKLLVDPYGNPTARAHMHPGFQSKDIIGPSGPSDPGLSILAAQTLDGTPIALLANYAPHYFGTGMISADYYGVFCRAIAKQLNQESSEGPFVAMMSQGTSGDQSSRDYHKKKAPPSMELYGQELATRALEAYKTIQWHDNPPIDITEKIINLPFRMPDPERLAWARKTLNEMKTELPRGWPEVYSNEAVILHGRKNSDLKLQAIRIGSLTITTFPNEVYAITGLKMKQQAPLDQHFNIELANGSVGYIPPPEQHELGGYTTWAARTAGLDIQAEPIIVETLLSALEEITEKKRKPITETDGLYTQAIKAAKPVAYWRMNEIQGRTAHSAIPDGPSATLSGGAALYLPGVATGGGGGEAQQLTPSAFSGSDQYNRAIHFVIDGRMEATIPELDTQATVAFWFWLGETSGASKRTGTLCTLPTQVALTYTMDETGETTLNLSKGTPPTLATLGKAKLSLGKWHFAVLEAKAGTISLYVDGNDKADAAIPFAGSLKGEPLRFAKGLEGKLDEIAVFDRAITPKERNTFWMISGVPARWAKAEKKISQAKEEAVARATPPRFPQKYSKTINDLKPILQASLKTPHEKLIQESSVNLTEETYAEFNGGRLNSAHEKLSTHYSISLWFKNTLDNNSRAVTGYLFSRGAKNKKSETGDHLGIAGTYGANQAGKLILYTGDATNKVVAGQTAIPPNTWNHLVFVRNENHVTLYLNGEIKPDIDTQIPATSTSKEIFLGARSDHFAPFEGYLAEFALFDRVLTAKEAKAIHAASNQPLGTATTSPPKPKLKLSSQPLDPEKGRASIQVPKGYTVDLVASEPQVFDPVAFDWDTKGALWVVEMADYPLGLGDKNAAGGRVRKLEDRDGDGSYETSSLFAEGLNFPTGILTWRDGIIVTAAPDIIFLQDSTGDGKADQHEVLLTGLTQGNQQLRANGLRWGLDNWVYVAAGGHHGKYGLETTLRSTRADTKTKVGSRDFRFRPDTGQVEAQSGPTQFGRNRDNWGRWFGTQNSHPLWHYALPDHYLKRNPYLAAPDGKVQVLGTSNPPVYPASRLQKRYHNFQQSGRYTSACGGMIYRDGLLFPDQETNGFVCEPFQNLVQRIVLEPKGVSFEGKQMSAPNAPDFFASEDRWCRPVMARTGPDGALWIADMYRYMIEHPDWLPEKGKQELLPFYRKGEDRGRIYRVRPTATPVSPIPVLETLSTPQLVSQLNSSNGWLRDKTQQLLLWRADTTAIPLLEKMATRSTSALARLHALCTLDGLEALSSELVTKALADPHPGVRENALRLAERRWTPDLQSAVLTLTTDPNAPVRQQLAFTLGAFPVSPEVGSALATVLLGDSQDPLITTAALSSALPHQSSLINELLARNHPALPTLRVTITEMALASADKTSLATLLNPLFSKTEKSLTPQLADECAQIIGLLKRRNTSIKKLTKGTQSKPLIDLAQNYTQLIEKARKSLDNANTPPATRLASATLLARIPAEQEKVTSYLSDQLLKNNNTPKALAILSHIHTPQVAKAILNAWPDFSPEAREQGISIMLSRVEWTQQLLQAVENNTLQASDIAPVHRARLLNHSNKTTKALASKLLQVQDTSTRTKVVEQYAPSLKIKGDTDQGQIKYQELCAACHKYGAKGFDIGPDLSTVSEHPKEKLLANILDPNLDIQPGYHAYTCELKNGDLLFGLITAENATSITLKLPGAITHTILRSDIEFLDSSNQSMMPEGWEESLSHQDMADLIAFLRERQ